MNARALADQVQSCTEPTRPGGWWNACCPAHSDTEPSFGFRDGDRRLLVKCFAGCTPERIAEALGVTLEELRRLDDQNHRRVIVSGDFTVADYAAAKGLPEEFLTEIGLHTQTYKDHRAVVIPYLDAAGHEVCVKYRVALHGINRLRVRRGDHLHLYGLWRLPQARREGYVVVVEGESDTQTLWYHGIPAVGVPGAGNWNEARDAAHLDGILNIFVVIEPDRGGENAQEWLSRSAIRDRTHLVYMCEDVKDVSELYLVDPARFRERWDAMRTGAIPWRFAQDAALRQRAAAAQAACASLAREPRILDRFAEAFRARGVVGEERAGKLIFLAATSARVLPRPISAVIKGPSSTGKNHVTENALAFVPQSCLYTATSMSERALIYEDDEPFAYRTIVVYEQAGLDSDFLTYVMRSLLSEQRLRYKTVEKTRDGRMRTRTIERDGPTNLITTTTKISIDGETETRLISIPLNDSTAQTQAIFEALGAIAEGDIPVSPDVRAWHALQEWLALNQYRVVVPFGRRLGRLTQPVAVRLRRDLGTVLGLIKTHAALHQATRERDGEGRIIATIEGDYRPVWELVRDLFGDAINASVSASIREVVNAVRRLTAGSTPPATVARVAAHLNHEHSTTWRHLQAAIARGYVVNLEDRKHRPARLIAGEEMPCDREVLPDPNDPGLQVCTESEGGVTPPPASTGHGDPEGDPPDTPPSSRANTQTEPDGLLRRRVIDHLTSGRLHLHTAADVAAALGVPEPEVAHVLAVIVADHRERPRTDESKIIIWDGTGSRARPYRYGVYGSPPNRREAIRREPLKVDGHVPRQPMRVDPVNGHVRREPMRLGDGR